MFSVEDYKKIKTWKQKYPNNQVILDFSKIPPCWFKFMKDIIENNDIGDIERKLSECVLSNKNIFPYPDMLFSFFKYTDFNNLKGVILGQDPYPKFENDVPQAMGLSFSVPIDINIPSSLDNIYKNMIKYGHINKYPDHGNLQFLANQGILLLNTSLTVAENDKNGHSDIWKNFTDSIIMKLSNDFQNLFFVLWGSPALEKFNLIDRKKHLIVISSHPSGLSCNKPLKNHPPFNQQDHFGIINNYLKQNGKSIILFDQ